MSKINLATLNRQELGKHAKDLVKEKFLSIGYSVEIKDCRDCGIDMIVKKGKSAPLEVKVKSCRDTTNYIFVPKKAFCYKKENLYMVVVIFINNRSHDMYIIPAVAWQNPDRLLRNRPYDKPGMKSKAEWGLNVSNRNMDLMEEYEFNSYCSKLKRK